MFSWSLASYGLDNTPCITQVSVEVYNHGKVALSLSLSYSGDGTHYVTSDQGGLMPGQTRIVTFQWGGPAYLASVAVCGISWTAATTPSSGGRTFPPYGYPRRLVFAPGGDADVSVYNATVCNQSTNSAYGYWNLDGVLQYSKTLAPFECYTYKYEYNKFPSTTLSYGVQGSQPSLMSDGSGGFAITNSGVGVGTNYLPYGQGATNGTLSATNTNPTGQSLTDALGTNTQIYLLASIAQNTYATSKQLGGGGNNYYYYYSNNSYWSNNTYISNNMWYSTNTMLTISNNSVLSNYYNLTNVVNVTNMGITNLGILTNIDAQSNMARSGYGSATNGLGGDITNSVAGLFGGYSDAQDAKINSLSPPVVSGGASTEVVVGSGPYAFHIDLLGNAQLNGVMDLANHVIKWGLAIMAAFYVVRKETEIWQQAMAVQGFSVQNLFTSVLGTGTNLGIYLYPAMCVAVTSAYAALALGLSQLAYGSLSWSDLSGTIHGNPLAGMDSISLAVFLKVFPFEFFCGLALGLIIWTLTYAKILNITISMLRVIPR